MNIFWVFMRVLGGGEVRQHARLLSIQQQPISNILTNLRKSVIAFVFIILTAVVFFISYYSEGWWGLKDFARPGDVLRVTARCRHKVEVATMSSCFSSNLKLNILTNHRAWWTSCSYVHLSTPGIPLCEWHDTGLAGFFRCIPTD